MHDPKETTHVIYHANCPDGFGAAFAAWLLLGDKAQYIPAKYGEAPPELPSDAHVVIVDFSYPRLQLEKLNATVKSLLVLDHHKTAQADLNGLHYAIFDMTHSGAYLAWTYFHEGSVPDLILYLEDRDLWRWALPNSKEISATIGSYPRDFETWNIELFQGEFETLVTQGESILRYKNQQVQLQADQFVWWSVNGHLVPVVNTTTEFSEVGEELCMRYPEAPFAMYYFDRGDGKRQFGLRSRNGFDVSVIAKQFGGGGHPAAAGFQLEAGKLP